MLNKVRALIKAVLLIFLFGQWTYLSSMLLEQERLRMVSSLEFERTDCQCFFVLENWIKLLNTATECNSDVLVLKCAESIKEVMDSRHAKHADFRKKFSDIKSAPNQLFPSSLE